MDCYICRDRGVVKWTENRDGAVYEFMGRCDCKAGRRIEGLPSASAHLSPFELSDIARENKRLEEEDAQSISCE